jgi:SAM-dependent methyltransferase
MRFLDVEGFDVREYYRSEYRKKHNYIPGKKMTPEERFLLMRPVVAERARFFKDHVPHGGSVLEIGCSSGFFLDAIQDTYDVYGSEWDAQDAAYVRDVGGLPCEEGDLADIYPGKSFSAICAYRVLEHQPNPVEWLKQVATRLVSGGYIVVEVPNSEEALLTLYDIPEFKDFWWREAHPVNFNLSNLIDTMLNGGFESNGHTYQEYSLRNHMEWLWNRKPMQDPIEAREFYAPVAKDHPASPWMNRLFRNMDKEYRNELVTAKAGNVIRAVGRRLDI